MGRIETPQFVVVPAVLSGKGIEQKVAVVPLTDKWLGAKERTWQEVEGVLEGRVKDCVDAFQFTKEPSVLAQKYGIERPISGNMARFLAYVDLVDEYQAARASHSGRANKERGKYEAEKAEIMVTRYSNGRKRQLMAEAWNKHEAIINDQVIRAEEEERVCDLIYRKAVLDTFSLAGVTNETAMPLVLQNFPKRVQEARTAFGSPANLSSDTFKQRVPIDYFLSGLSDYLRTSRDGELFSRYTYRKNPELVYKGEDCEVLDAMMGLVIGSEAATADSGKEEWMRDLGSAYFAFLKKQAQSDRVHEAYPCSTLLFDIATASYYRGRPFVINGASKIIESYFGDWLGTNMINREIKDMNAKRFGLILGLEQELSSIVGRIKVKENGEVEGEVPFLDPVSDQFLDAISSKEMRILTAFGSLHWSSRGRKGRLGKNEVMLRLGMAIETSYRDWLWGLQRKDIERFLTALVFEVTTSRFSRERIYASRDVDADYYLFSFSMPDEHSLDATKQEGDNEKDYVALLRGGLDKSERIGRVRDWCVHAGDPDLREEPTKKDFLNLYQTVFWRERVGNHEQYAFENEYLWDQVLDNPIWFVSPRGDRFAGRSDPQLSEMAIETITFIPDRKFAREHRVEVLIEGVDSPFEFWLDTKRNLLGSSRAVLLLDPRFKQAFSNLLLRRLYFITSGLLAREQDRPLVSGDHEREFFVEFRRAHYRFLVSTLGRRITMESHGAEVHAREIKAKFGIDIFEEIRRRRAIGTLKQSQYLTFVDEVTTDIGGRLILPNNIAYDPALVEIPIYHSM